MWPWCQTAVLEEVTVPAKAHPDRQKHTWSSAGHQAEWSQQCAHATNREDGLQ